MPFMPQLPAGLKHKLCDYSSDYDSTRGQTEELGPALSSIFMFL